jgi:hypothetical protein
MYQQDAFIQEHFPGAMPTHEQRESGDISHEEFFPDMTEKQFSNIPEEIREVILTAYPHLKKYCQSDKVVEQLARSVIQEEVDLHYLEARVKRLEKLEEDTRELHRLLDRIEAQEKGG